MVTPLARPAVEAAYWRLAAERQAIFHKRAVGVPAPWTSDPVLLNYKFCNAYRASDRVSQFLIRRVIYVDQNLSPESLLLRIVLFRLFSRIDTWVGLEAATGGVSVGNFDFERYDAILARLRSQGPIYTSAFILSASPSFGHTVKHRNHLALVQRMLSTGLSRKVAKAASLRSVYESLLDYPLIGPFMAYQIAVDINYSELTDFSENDFTVAGPGALRGIAKVFDDLSGLSPSQVIMYMVACQEDAFLRHGLSFRDLFGRSLHAIDCQNLFCEVDKYSRQAFPELRSNRVKIKARFRQSAAPLHLFYPPKWQINQRVPLQTDVMRIGGCANVSPVLSQGAGVDAAGLDRKRL